MDWVLKDPKPPSMSGWLLTGVARFSSTECLILQEARLTAAQSQGSKKVKAEALRFLKTQALGLAQWRFHHIIIGSIKSQGQAQIQRGGETDSAFEAVTLQRGMPAGWEELVDIK